MKKEPVRVRLEFTAVRQKEGYVYFESGRLKTLRRMLRKRLGDRVADNLLEEWYAFCAEESVERAEHRRIAP